MRKLAVFPKAFLQHTHQKLEEIGADYALLDDENLIENILKLYPKGVDKVLELLGPETMKDSFKALKDYGTLCITGILAKKEYIENFDPIKDIPNNKYLCSFFSNYPSQEKIDEIFDFIYKSHIKPVISDVYPLEEVSKGHLSKENNDKIGKVVIKINNN